MKKRLQQFYARSLVLIPALCCSTCFGGPKKMELNTIIPYASMAVAESNHSGTLSLTFNSVNPATQELTTQQFSEHGAHGGEMRSFKPISWEHKLSADIKPWGSNAGNDNGFYQSYWINWSDAKTLNSLAITLENPIETPILAGDELIHPAIVTADKQQRIYFWRNENGKHALYRHIFQGEINKTGKVITEKILEIPYQPFLSQADAIPMALVKKQGFQERGLAVIGWLSTEGQSLYAHVVWINQDGYKLFSSDPISSYGPFPKQRLAIWASPEGKIHLAWLMKRLDSDTLRMAKFSLDIKTGFKNLRIHSEGYAGKRLHSAASVLGRRDDEESAVCYLLTETGNLYLQYATGLPKKIRDQVSLDYDFPIFASGINRYEARLDPKKGLYFEPSH